jgi:hypothetical protein
MNKNHPPAQGVRLMVAPGVRCSGYTDAYGDVHADLPLVRAFGIRDLAQVVEHRISHVYDSVGHYVRFNNGGYLSYMRDTQGKVIEFYINGLDAVLSAEGDITVWPPET